MSSSPKVQDTVRVLVRRNRVVWSLEVESDGRTTGKFFTPTQGLAELRKYAAEQKLRAGSG